MLIEFTGPSASGKTALAKIIAKKDNNIRQLRASSTGSYIEEMQLRAFQLWFFISHLNKFFSGTICSYNWLCSMGFSRKLSFLRGIKWGIIRSVLAGAKGSSKTFLRDQGVFQFGSWVDSELVENTDIMFKLIQNSSCFPDALVMFSFPAEVSERRVKYRGDISKAHKCAAKRGFDSFKAMCSHGITQEKWKIDIAKKANIFIVIVDINHVEKIESIGVVNAPCKVTSFPALNQLLQTISDNWQQNGQGERA